MLSSAPPASAWHLATAVVTWAEVHQVGGHYGEMIYSDELGYESEAPGIRPDR